MNISECTSESDTVKNLANENELAKEDWLVIDQPIDYSPIIWFQIDWLIATGMFLRSSVNVLDILIFVLLWLYFYMQLL